ncbi:hypothetical protein LguiB_021063 [Lonicera macranthoides]
MECLEDLSEKFRTLRIKIQVPSIMHHSLVQIRWNWKCLEIMQLYTTRRWKIT